MINTELEIHCCSCITLNPAGTVLTFKGALFNNYQQMCVNVNITFLLDMWGWIVTRFEKQDVPPWKIRCHYQSLE